MKMNNFKSNIILAASILLFVMLLLIFVRHNVFQNGETKINQSDPSNVVNQEPLGKYNPAIDISFVRAVDDDLLNNILPHTPGETIEDNRWLRLYSEQLGIDINYNWTVKGGYNEENYNKKINVTIASGNLPDVLPVNANQLKQLVDLGMIEDMTSYYKDYASALTKNIYNQPGKSTLESATINGRLMAMPNADDSIESAQFLWIRADWLKNLGLKPPETMEDLLQISYDFTKKDPDGNGKDDTYGLAITKYLYNTCMGLEGFFAGYHSYPNFWHEDETGKIVYGSIQPETKIALKKLSEMYKDGQIDKEFSVKDIQNVAQSIANGKCGIQFGEQWNPMYPLISSFNNDNNADWTGYSLVSADGSQVMVPLKFRTNLYFAVRKGYSNPEAVVNMINMFLEKLWGTTNEFDKYYMPVQNNNQGVWKYSPVTPHPQYKNLTAYMELEKARKSNDFSKLEAEPKKIQSSVEAYAKGDKLQWGWEKIYGVNGVYSVLRKYKESNSLLYEGFTGFPTKTMAEKKEVLLEYEKEEFVKIIMGAAPIDEFDVFVENWHKMGGKEITKEVNVKKR